MSNMLKFYQCRQQICESYIQKQCRKAYDGLTVMNTIVAFFISADNREDKCLHAGIVRKKNLTIRSRIYEKRTWEIKKSRAFGTAA